VILACPLIHIFMHRGHGHSHAHGTKAEPPFESLSLKSQDKGK
jgi:hypothetical protein